MPARPGAGLRFEEFDFSYYNRTPFTGLENDLANCYTNALLQAGPWCLFCVLSVLEPIVRRWWLHQTALLRVRSRDAPPCAPAYLGRLSGVRACAGHP